MDAKPTVEKNTSSPYRILLVDDEPNVLNALQRVLRQENYQVVTANNGKEALELLRHAPFHLIITDYMMPVMNGGDLLRQAKTLHPEMIRILLTGHADTAAIMAVVNEGAVYKFILKPWNDDELRVTLALALEQSELISKLSRREKSAGRTDMNAKPPVRAGFMPRPWTPEELAVEDRGLQPASHWILIAIGSFFAAGLLWAALAEIDEVTRGEGKIITSSQTQYIQNLEGGIISQILVREGEMVQKDQVLFRIDPTRFVSELQGSQQEILALRARIARLTAESQGTPLAMTAKVTEDAPLLDDNEVALHLARQRDLTNKNGILREQLTQREQELVEIRTRAERLNESFGFLQKEISITAPLVKEGIISQVELLRLKREAARVRTDLDGARLTVPRVQAAIEEARRRMEDNELAFRSQAASELAEAKGKLAKLEETIPAFQDRVSRAEVRSPVKGLVKVIPNKTLGGVVQPGSPLAEIVPVEDNWLVEAKIKPIDIAFVSVGQLAVVKITAYDYSIYGGIEGRVVHVSGDSIQPQQGDPYFIAHVRTNVNGIEFQGKLLPAIPGMTATVDVLTGSKTVLHYLLKPINKAGQRALRER